MDIRIYGDRSQECYSFLRITEDCIRDHEVGAMCEQALHAEVLTPEEVELLYQFGQQLVEYGRGESHAHVDD